MIPFRLFGEVVFGILLKIVLDPILPTVRKMVAFHRLAVLEFFREFLTMMHKVFQGLFFPMDKVDRRHFGLAKIFQWMGEKVGRNLLGLVEKFRSLVSLVVDIISPTMEEFFRDFLLVVDKLRRLVDEPTGGMDVIRSRLGIVMLLIRGDGGVLFVLW